MSRFVTSLKYPIFAAVAAAFTWALISGIVMVRADVASSTTEASTTIIAASPGSLTRDQLASQIQEKSKELDAINTQLQATKQSLQGTKQQKVTLQQQLASIDGNISQLTLNIQGDQISAQKLGLEINSLNYDIQDIESSIIDKRSAIEKIIVALEKNDTVNNNLLMLFLKSDSLADGVMEAQNLNDLQAQLTSDITGLRDLHDQYNTEIAAASQKKNGVVLAQQDLLVKKSIVRDQKSMKQTLLQSTKNQESLYQQQLGALQKQQEQINSEIESIDAVLRTKIDPSMLPPLGAGVLLIPVQGDSQSSVTQGYGATTFARTEYVKHWHNGVDFAASIGTPILAAADGTVAAAANEDLYCPRGAYGKFIVINHNDGLTTLYGHLSKQLVSPGQSVKRGQIIGYSGNTGDTTGPHLHFTVFAQPTYYLSKSKYCGPLPQGGDLNPLGYLF